jgi:hypothetical protein
MLRAGPYVQIYSYKKSLRFFSFLWKAYSRKYSTGHHSGDYDYYTCETSCFVFFISICYNYKNLSEQ